MIKFPKLTTTLLSAILLLSTAYGQSDKLRIRTYVNTYKELAISEMLRTGVPASVTLAQGILETAGGQSDLASMANNHFGIKCKSEWTGETMHHDDDAKNECFRKYSSPEDSYKDHSDFLRTRPVYAFLFKLDPTDFEGWAKGLKKAGYATNPVYAEKLIKIIVDNNLQQYTLLAMEKQGNEGPSLALASKEEEKVELKNTVSKLREVLTNAKLAAKQSFERVSSIKKESYPVNSVFNINEAKVVLATGGTSLFALAANYNVSYKKLLDFNDLDVTDILTKDQLIFLQKKQKRGAKDFHVIEENEDLHDVSQKEGVQLSSVLEFNHLQKGMIPAVGEKIYLKSSAPVSPKLATAAYRNKSISMK
jgi:LysM repeat protein